MFVLFEVMTFFYSLIFYISSFSYCFSNIVVFVISLVLFCVFYVMSIV